MNRHTERLRNALEEQHKRWFDYSAGELKDECGLHIDCPVCQSKESFERFNKDWFRFVQCKECGMVYLNPRLNDRATYEFYNSEWNAIYNEEKFEATTNESLIDDRVNAGNLKAIVQILGTPNDKRLLEIGIGKGFFLSKAKEAGFSVYGVELNAANCQNARGLVGDVIHEGDLHSADFPTSTFDVVYMKDVFEHVPNPALMLREIQRIVRDGGLLFVEVPNIEGLIYHLVKERHVCLFGFEHLNYWSPASLDRIMQQSGFQVISCKHESIDFTVARIAAHFVVDPDNCLFPPHVSRIKRFLSKALLFLFSRMPLRWLDQRLTPLIADASGRGSVIRVMARKKVATNG